MTAVRIEETQRRLLFVSRSFPPWENVAAIRTGSIAKFLGMRGWDVTVVTVDPTLFRRDSGGGGNRAEAPDFPVKRILTDHFYRCLVPGFMKEGMVTRTGLVGGAFRRIASLLHVDSGIGWIRPIMERCSALNPGDVDLVLASGPPFSSFVAAERLSEKLKCPFAMDYRDPWSFRLGGQRLREPWNLGRERRLVRKASAVTIVSRTLAELYEREFPIAGKVRVITNGFDPDAFVGIEPRRTRRFNLVYAGNLHPPSRTLDPVLEAIALLHEEDRGAFPVQLDYFGRQGEFVASRAEHFGVTDSVVVHGLVSRRQALDASAGADVIVVVASVVDSSDLAARGVVTGKIYEALGLRKPVLLVAPRGSDAAAIIERTQTGKAFVGNDINGIAGYLREVASGRTRTPSEDAIEDYSWVKIAGSLDRVLREAIAEAGSAGEGARW